MTVMRERKSLRVVGGFHTVIGRREVSIANNRRSCTQLTKNADYPASGLVVKRC